jgi:hypothetical protein
LIFINIQLISHTPVVAMSMIEQVLIFASMCSSILSLDQKCNP